MPTQITRSRSKNAAGPFFCLYQILPPPSFHSDPPQADKPASADPDVKPGLGHPPKEGGSAPT